MSPKTHVAAHRSRLGRVACALMLFASVLICLPADALACTSSYLGTSVTADGTTMFSRSEDYDGRHVKRFGVAAAADHDPAKESYSNAGDGGSFSMPYPTHTLRFTYVYDGTAYTGDSDTYAAGGQNERGVSMSATVTTYLRESVSGKNGFDPLLGSGLAECNAGSIILGQATSARGACELLGNIIDTHGAGEGYQIIISDASETWMFYSLSGHQWVAFKLDDDVASVNPNLGSLKVKLDLDDSQSVIHSTGILKLATDNGFAKYFADDNSFDVMGSYGQNTTGTDDLDSAGCLTRYYQALSYFNPSAAKALTVTTNSKGAINNITDPQLIFTPASSSITLEDEQEFLSTRGEGTMVDGTTNTKLYSVGNPNQTECHIFQTHRSRAAQVSTVEWLAMSRSKYSVYVPYYSALVTDVADCCKQDTDQYESKDPMSYTIDGNIDQAFIDINDLCDANPDTCGTNVEKYFASLQADINAQQQTVDPLMISLYSSDSASAQERATTASKSLTTQLDKKAETLLTEMKAYLAAGDTSSDFVPSDMNADGTAKSRFVYADYLIAPTITTDPVSATYAQGAAVSDLSVTATENDNVEGSDALLTYQWFEKTGESEGLSVQSEDGSTPAGYTAAGTSATFTPSSATVGTTTYMVRVTNAAGVSTDSEEATITVTAAKKDDASYNTNGNGETVLPKGTDTGSNAKSGTGSLPKTGDTTNYAIPFLLVALAVTAGGTAYALRKHTSR